MELDLYWIEAVSVISDEGGLTGLEPFPLNMSKDIARGDHGTIVENFNDGADKVNPLQNYAGLETFIVRFFFSDTVLWYLMVIINWIWCPFLLQFLSGKKRWERGKSYCASPVYDTVSYGIIHMVDVQTDWSNK